MSEWLSIESAPKDRHLTALIYVPNDGIYQADRIWDTRGDHAWMISMHDRVYPTHWQPLPDPPGER